MDADRLRAADPDRRHHDVMAEIGKLLMHLR
jgi:hypothetical protein